MILDSTNFSGLLELKTSVSKLEEPQMQVLVSKLTETQQGLLRDLKTSDSIGFDELGERIDDAKALIASGAARLLVVQSPWGIEFALELDGRHMI
jgi:hypothetical protein